MTRKQSERSSKQSTNSHSNGAKKLSFTRPSMSVEMIKLNGEKAAELLNSPIYNLAVNSVVDDLGSEVLATEPHESHKREWLYQQGAAIGRVNQKLFEFVQMAQQLHMDDITAEESAQIEKNSNAGFN